MLKMFIKINVITIAHQEQKIMLSKFNRFILFLFLFVGTNIQIF